MADLNDSGIDWCTDGVTLNLPCPVAGYPRQDGEDGRDARVRDGFIHKEGGGIAGFEFSKVSANGDVLPPSATSWACVYDHVTQLTWELKLNNPPSPRHQAHLYSWYDPNPQTNGGREGSPGWTSSCGNSLGGQFCNTHNLIAYVNQQGMCGHRDWRLPSRRELQSIVLMGQTPHVDRSYFDNLPAATYWTSTRYAGTGPIAWQVNLFHGDSHPVWNGDLRVVLVRGGR